MKNLKMYLWYVIYALCVIGSVVTTVLSVLILNWFVVLFANKDGNLPWYLSYFQTFDASLDQGHISGEVDLGTYLNRVYWLYRNPAYGFDYYVFGVNWKWEEWTVEEYTVTKDSEGNSISTKFYATHPSGMFNYFHESSDFSYKFGWKAWNHFNTETKTLDRPWGITNDKVPLAFTPKFW